MVKNVKLQAVLKLIIGGILLLSAAWGYLPIPNHMNEYTFLSNIFEGLVLLYSGLLLISKRKHTPTIIDLCLVILAFIMLGICVTNNRIFGFQGAFLFLHVLNPILILLHWIFVTEKGKIEKAKHFFAVFVLPGLYMIFLFIYGSVTGNYIYPIFDVKVVGLYNVAMLVLMIGLIFGGLSYLLYFIDKKVGNRNSY
ncbi:MAG: Pr6Pr family membrane protein [Eubacteriales bacterium]|nr:Pr6Pr family membrane protein [Eubacteriales bacterium]